MTEEWISGREFVRRGCPEHTFKRCRREKLLECKYDPDVSRWVVYLYPQPIPNPRDVKRILKEMRPGREAVLERRQAARELERVNERRLSEVRLEYEVALAAWQRRAYNAEFRVIQLEQELIEARDS